MNTGAPPPDLDEAKGRVLRIQTKLHRWASDDPGRRFDDLFNLVTDPATLLVAWERVRTNKGARTAGVDGSTAHYIRAVRGEGVFLAELRADLRDVSFAPLAVRERMIPKSGGRLRRLGIPTVRDRVAQAALKLVLEPIFEADFKPCSYGFRPKRRAQDAIAEIHYLASRSLSVSGVARQGKPVGRGWFFAGGWAWRTELGSRWSGRSAAWTTTLTPARDATG